jgi:hypothetical protein
LDREARSHRVHADFSFAWIVKSLFVILQVLKVIIVIIIDQEYLNTRVGIYFIISFMAESTDPVQQAVLHQEDVRPELDSVEGAPARLVILVIRILIWAFMSSIGAIKEP